MRPLRFSRRAETLQPSATMAISARAGQMRRDGIDVVALSAGEPDFATPQHIRAAAAAAIEEGKTRYTPAAGVPELREAAADWLGERVGVRYDASQLIATNGAKQALYNLCTVLLDHGDTAVIGAPCWVTYPAQVRLASAEPRVIPPRRDGRLDVDAMVRALAGSKLLLLCNPSNPTGEVIGPDGLRRIGDAAREHGVLVVVDEIYSELVYTESGFTPFLRACPDMVDQTLVVHGVSKAFSMTGWRIGFCAAPPAIARKLSALMSQTTSNPCSIAQYAAIAALRGSHDFLDEWRAHFKRRRDLVVDGLRGLDGVDCFVPEGAFYAFPDVRRVLRKRGLSEGDDVALAAQILEEAHVATVPGSPFHAPGHIRVSYAASEEDLEKALERLRGWV